MLLEVSHVEISYGGPNVVKDVSMSLATGAIGCLLGPSGCGKTTLLRAIAGFEPLRSGSISLHGHVVSDARATLPPESRRIGMVFQDLALFPHLDIAANIAFGLRRLERGERQRRVAELLALIGLKTSATAYPHQLSGGQQQRVAVARAMAPRPDLLLLDEPFSSLDEDLREKLARDVRQMLKEDGLTALLVTHDQFEAFAMADEVGVMHDGLLHQWDSAYNLYHQPASEFVANFIGEGVLLPGVIINEQQIQTGLGVLEGNFSYHCFRGRQVRVLIRPEDIIHDDDLPVKAEVLRRHFRGANILYTLRLNSGDEVQALVPSHCSHATGDIIGIRPDVRHLVLFEEHPRV